MIKSNVGFFSSTLSVQTLGRGTFDITAELNKVVSESKCAQGMLNVFLQHTSASLIICENADPVVREDLERFATRFCPDGDPIFQHIDEGPDDMPAHIRSIFTQTSLQIPINNKRLALGSWQGVYLWEHRSASHLRRLVLSIIGL